MFRSRSDIQPNGSAIWVLGLNILVLVFMHFTASTKRAKIRFWSNLTTHSFPPIALNECHKVPFVMISSFCAEFSDSMSLFHVVKVREGVMFFFGNFVLHQRC